MWNMAIFLSPQGLRPIGERARTATVPHTQHAVANLSMTGFGDTHRFGTPALHPAHGFRARGCWRGSDPRSAPAGETGNGSN